MKSCDPSFQLDSSDVLVFLDGKEEQLLESKGLREDLSSSWRCLRREENECHLCIWSDALKREGKRGSENKRRVEAIELKSLSRTAFLMILPLNLKTLESHASDWLVLNMLGHKKLDWTRLDARSWIGRILLRYWFRMTESIDRVANLNGSFTQNIQARFELCDCLLICKDCNKSAHDRLLVSNS